MTVTKTTYASNYTDVTKTFYTINLPNGEKRTVDSDVYEYLTETGKCNPKVRERDTFREAVLTAFDGAWRTKQSPYQRPVDFLMDHRVKLFYAPRHTGKTTILKDLYQEAREPMVFAPNQHVSKVFKENVDVKNNLVFQYSEFTSKGTSSQHFNARMRGSSRKIDVILLDEYAFGGVQIQEWIKALLIELGSTNNLAEDVVVVGASTPF
jgi:hypothetical protein